MSVNRVSCGLEYSHTYDISYTLQESGRSGYDFVSVSLVHPRFGREFINGKAKDRKGAFTRADLILPSTDWNSLVVGRISSDSCLLCESEVKSVRRTHESIILQELTYAAHLALPAILIPLHSAQCVNLARILHNKALAGVNYQIWVRVCMQSHSDNSNAHRSDLPETEEFKCDTWSWWNKFHSIANLEKKMGVALEVSANLPDESVLDRWLGEPIKSAILPTSIFLTNKGGFPVLSKAHQTFVLRLIKQHVQFIITGPIRHSHIKLYQQYLDHLFKQTHQPNPVTDFARGYEDFLQSPLQPLMDNLESQTYEVFERDPVKYREYERALHLAITQKASQYGEQSERKIVVMVLGAGRGPLVRRALSASKMAGRELRIYAVEKNPNAVVTLQAQQDENWGETVTVVSCDMREWNPPEKADIIISELLGSFGDNELSPECLDAAQVFLKEDGICIPNSYTSFLGPVQSPKIFNEIRFCERNKVYTSQFETPYVVFLQNKMDLASTQPLFTFTHPNKDSVIDNRRYKRLKFPMKVDSVVHGLAGYFETTLFGDVTLSINPETHSEGMFSWFPILFPLKEPVPVKAGDVLEVHFWRCLNSQNVWYEWSITSPSVIPIHNPNGRSYTIGL